MPPSRLNAHHSDHCGLICYLRPSSTPAPSRPRKALALRSVAAEAKVVDLCASVQLTQYYVNQTGADVEAEYIFPIDNRAAVSAFEIEIDGEITTGVVKEKIEARQNYEAAISAGDSAQLLEHVRDDVFQMTVGNLRPWSSIVVRITYIADVKFDHDAVTFFLPTFVAPRYSPISEHDPVPAGTLPPHEGLKFELVAAMASDIIVIESKTPGIELTATKHPENSRICTASLSTAVTSLDRDLVVRIVTLNPHQPRCLVEHDTEADTFAGVVTLCPKLEFDDERREIIFLVDRSGSMRGEGIRQAKQALQLFFRSLPEDCYINIIGFGSRHEFLWPSSVKYSKASLDKATAHIERLDANLGGTELCNPLRVLLSTQPVSDYDRQVFVLTDGQVSNTAETVQVIREAVDCNPTTRVFALGLGNGASHDLVEGIAEAGNGTADFSIDQNKLPGKVIRQLQHAIQPALNHVSISWENAAGAPPSYDDHDSIHTTKTPSGREADLGGLLGAFAPSSAGSLLGFSKKKPQPENPADTEGFARAPFANPPVLSGERYLSYVLIQKGGKPPSAVTITARSPAGNLDVRLPVTAADRVQGKLLHTMAARALIHDLQKGRSWMHSRSGHAFAGASVKSEIVRLGTTYSLASRHTSFVVVPKGTEYHQHDNSAIRLSDRRATRGRGGGGCYSPVRSSFPMSRSAPRTPKNAISKGYEARSFLRSAASPRNKSVQSRGGGTPDYEAFQCLGGISQIRSIEEKKKKASGSPAKFWSEASSDSDDDCEEDDDCDDEFLSGYEKEKSSSTTSSMAARKKKSNKKSALVAGKSEKACLPPSDSAVQKLVILQDFSGSFEFDFHFAEAVNITIDALETAAVTESSRSGIEIVTARKLIATAIAIVYFRQKLAEFKDQWVLVVNKATKWLRKATKGGSKTVGDFLDMAATLV